MPEETGSFASLSLDTMIEQVKARLSDPCLGDIPRYTMVLGAGFSSPIVPTGEMILEDIVWWLYLRETGESERYYSTLAADDVPLEYRKALWTSVHGSSKARFGLVDGLPTNSSAEDATRAYQALMSGCSPKGLCTPQLRRQYLRDVVRRAGRRTNPAHVLLASILSAQDEGSAVWRFSAPFCRTIFTTNFDPLFQRSLQLVDKLYYMSDRPQSLEQFEDDPHEAIHLVYVHGSVHRYFLVNNEAEVMETRRNAEVIQPYLRRHGVIVVGYGGWPDALMEAIGNCDTFDGNLYWCDQFSVEDAPHRLRAKVVAFLRRKAGVAFYVHIPSADDVMQSLHQGLELGEIPKFLTSPLDQLIGRISAIDVVGDFWNPDQPQGSLDDVRSEATSFFQAVVSAMADSGQSGKQQVMPLRFSFAAVRRLALTRLKEAKKVFDAPATPDTEMAKHLVEAALLTVKGNEEEGVAVWTSILETPQVAPEHRILALQGRAFTWALKGDWNREIDDLTALLDMDGVPEVTRAEALWSRAVAWYALRNPDKAITDATAVIQMPNVPPELAARARDKRAGAWDMKGEPDKAAEDYTAVIEAPALDRRQKAQALAGRAVVWIDKGNWARAVDDASAALDLGVLIDSMREATLFGRAMALSQLGKTDEAISDCTAMVKMRQATGKPCVDGLNFRAELWGAKGELNKAIADCTTVIGLADLPLSEKARALRMRGEYLARNDKLDEALADYVAVAEMDDAPPLERAKALAGKAWLSYKRGDLSGFVGNSRAALVLDPGLRRARFNLGLGLLLTGKLEASKVEYTKAASECTKASEIQREGIEDIQHALQQRGAIEGAQEILAMLQAREAALQEPAHTKNENRAE